jgi:AhpD family alkylhydroperoxidase
VCVARQNISLARSIGDMPVSRVDLLDGRKAPLLARPFYEQGDPGPIVAAIAHVPEVLEAAMPFISALFGPSALPARAKEIVVLRTSALLNCRYCIQAHSVVARDSGLSRAEVLALRGVKDLQAHFTDPSERALIDWIEAVASAPGPVPDRLSEAFRVHFADFEIVEVTLLIASTMMLNRFCTALELPSSPATLARLAEEELL